MGVESDKKGKDKLGQEGRESVRGNIGGGEMFIAPLQDVSL